MTLPAVCGDVSSDGEDSQPWEAEFDGMQTTKYQPEAPNVDHIDKHRRAHSPTEYYVGSNISRKLDTLFVRDEDVPNRHGIHSHRRGHVRITIRGDEARVFEVYRGCVAIVMEGDKYVGVSAST